MSQKGGANRSILSYFQTTTRAPEPPLTPRHSQLSSSISTPKVAASSPHLSSSPLRHKVTPVARRPVPVEIGASDDEGSDGGFSDDSLEDLGTLLGQGRPNYAAPSPPSRNPYTTPRAKRTAVEFYSSPLAIIPKHKFDLKTLAKDARLDDATNASSLRAKAAADAAQEESAAVKEESFGAAFADIVKEKSGQDAHKVLRAVQRAAPGQSQARYCFFDRDYRIPPTSPAPKLDSNSPWQLLVRGNSTARERHLASGVPQTVLAKKGGLPEPIFQWILDEMCIQKSLLTRQEYRGIIASCPDQVERLLTSQRLEELFIRLGATDELETRKSALAISKPSHEPYPDRDWSCLESFLVLLGTVSSHLSVESAIYATQMLLRMSMDKMLICNIDLLTVYEDTIQHLANAIPRSSWDAFCLDTCSLLHSNIKIQHIRANALLCLPVRDPRTHDLRRRLAVAFLFDDPDTGRSHPEEVVTISGIMDRLNGDDLNIRPQTDFAELKSTILLLDIAIDDGSAGVFANPEDEKRFNEDVDRLASKLREIWRRINDSGMKLARTEAKSVVEWVQQRLSHNVRTRRKAKKTIFDIPAGPGDDPSLPKQQDYMAKFLKKVPIPAPVNEGSTDIKA